MGAIGQQDQIRGQVVSYVLKNCSVEVPSATQATVVIRLGQDAIPYLIEAFESGPSQFHVDEVRDAATRRFGAIRQFIDRGSTFGLTAEDLARLRLTTEEAYARDAVNDFLFTYADTALRIASDVGGTAAERFLQGVAGDSTSVHAETATVLLLTGRQ